MCQMAAVNESFGSSNNPWVSERLFFLKQMQCKISPHNIITEATETTKRASQKPATEKLFISTNAQSCSLLLAVSLFPSVF